MSGYQYDVFISYRRSGNPHMWVRNHFFPRLTHCLADHLPYQPTLFLDEQMETGTTWPARLRDALLRTKILVPIYSAQYFQSHWCLAEWHSMADREELFGLSTLDRPQGLMYPILFADSENFPDFARTRSWRDLKEWNVPDLVYQQTAEWPSFHRQVESIAIELAGLLPRVPDWQPDWPVRQPDPPLPTPARMPSF